jgi:hypothetical protein
VIFRAVEINRLSVGSVYKLILIGLTFSVIPLSVVFGVFALFGAHTIQWNGKPVVGVAGLIAAPFVGAFIALLFTAILGTLAAIGLWVYFRFRFLKLSVVELKYIDEARHIITPAP